MTTDEAIAGIERDAFYAKNPPGTLVRYRLHGTMLEVMVSRALNPDAAKEGYIVTVDNDGEFLRARPKDLIIVARPGELLYREYRKRLKALIKQSQRSEEELFAE